MDQLKTKNVNGIKDNNMKKKIFCNSEIETLNIEVGKFWKEKIKNKNFIPH